MTEHYDAIVVGTGFASTFFLKKMLELVGSKYRVLVVEKGAHRSHAWQLANRDAIIEESLTTFERNKDKEWLFSIARGGGSNCWSACTPRFLPEDFELKSKYGIYQDWPFTYQDIEPYYCEAEELMSISGPDSNTLTPRSRPYPLPPHQFNAIDNQLEHSFPGLYFPQATARASQTTSKRPACCGNGVCRLCPINAKFTIENGLSSVYSDPRVSLLQTADVVSLGSNNSAITSVNYKVNDKDFVANGDFFVLGANAIFNPYILLNSGFDSPFLGKGIHEQASKTAIIQLDGLRNHQGSTLITGQGYMFYKDRDRSLLPAALVETWNLAYIGTLNIKKGRIGQTVVLKFIYEDFPEDENEVTVGDNGKPVVSFHRRSELCTKGLKHFPNDLEQVLKHLPVVSYKTHDMSKRTEAHIVGTTRMGLDPKSSVVDANNIHHVYRNLAVVGSSVFPYCTPSNPTLTLSAMSLRAADRTFGG